MGLLLQKVIRDGDEGAWKEIKARIDYTYENLDAALSALEKEVPFFSRIRERLNRRLYPGCILISLPRLKVHTQASERGENHIWS